MIVSYQEDSDDGYEFYTDGCGCCADRYYLKDDKEKIIEGLKDTYQKLKEMCDIVNVDIKEICI